MISERGVCHVERLTLRRLRASDARWRWPSRLRFLRQDFPVKTGRSAQLHIAAGEVTDRRKVTRGVGNSSRGTGASSGRYLVWSRTRRLGISSQP